MPKTKQPKPELHRCAMCDEMYDPNGDRAAIHEHPEPQSGPPREAWFMSGLPYKEWIQETPEGREWAEMYLYARRLAKAYMGENGKAMPDA